MQTVLLLSSAFLCFFSIFGLASSDTVTVLTLSHLVPFLPFFEVIPEIFCKFASRKRRSVRSIPAANGKSIDDKIMNMQVEVLKSKIHRVTITQANLSYVGSITIDEDLLDAAHLIAGEKVQIVNVNNGERLETYIIKGERGSGAVCLNGPAARKCVVGDVVIIISYARMDFEEAKSFTPWVVFPDTDTNRLIR